MSCEQCRGYHVPSCPCCYVEPDWQEEADEIVDFIIGEIDSLRMWEWDDIVEETHIRCHALPEVATEYAVELVQKHMEQRGIE